MARSTFHIIIRIVLAMTLMVGGTTYVLAQGGNPAEDCARASGSIYIVKFQMPGGEAEGDASKIAFISYDAGTDTVTLQNISGGPLNIAVVVKEGNDYVVQNIGVVQNGGTFQAVGVIQQSISHVTLCGFPIPTATPTNTPTNTPVPPTATPTNTPTNTPVPPTATPTNTPTDTPTNTPVPPTATPTSTPTDTPTNTPTSTPTDTPTNTPVPPTATPTSTPTDTPTNTPTSTPTDTPTNTPVPPTATPTSTPTDTPTNTPVPPTATPTNTPTPVVFEGCTPGYWKQQQHFDSWIGYAPNQTLESVFDVPDALGLDNATLLEALNFAGGSGTSGAARNLLRAAVASLLNSAQPNVDYPQTTAQVIAAVNAALASNNRNTMLTLAGQLDADNNRGCPLN